MERYITGTGQRIKVHSRNALCEKGCVIHNPTDPHKDWPTNWREDRYLMERICPHGVGHPDRDSVAFVRAKLGDLAAEECGVHGCDGCCDSSFHKRGANEARVYEGRSVHSR